jgi:hypothetical protein
MRLAGHVARMGEKRNAYRILVGKAEGKRPLGRRSEERRVGKECKAECSSRGSAWH